MTVYQAAKRLGFSERYIKKLKVRYKKNGVSSMIHGNCGKQPKHTLDLTLQNRIIKIKKEEDFKDCNVQHFRELLSEIYNIKISYTPLYNLLLKNGIKSPRKHKKRKAHQRRERRATLGKLLQADATPHNFFYGDNRKYTLHGFIDDATGQITGLYMSEHECMHGYLEATKQTINNFGIPLNIYADGSSIFFPKNNELSIEEQLEGKTKKQSQYGTMLELLGTNLIHAHSSQAKGRIERLWNTLQDRLVTEFKIYNITTIDSANIYLKKFIKKYNKKFKVNPIDNYNSFMPLPKNVNLDYILSVKFIRTADVSNSISINGNTFKIDTKEILHKKKLEICVNKKIGVKVFYNNKWYNVIPLTNKKNSQNSNESVKTIIENFIYTNCLKNERISA